MTLDVYGIIYYQEDNHDFWNCDVCGIPIFLKVNAWAVNSPLVKHSKWHTELEQRLQAAAKSGRDPRLNVIGGSRHSEYF